MKKMLFVSIVCFLLSGWMPAFGGQILGTVKPFMCVIYGISCPINQEDPVSAAANHLVVFTDDERYYFVLNLSDRVLARHLFETVRIKGDVKEKYRAIYADSLEVYEDGEWVTTWAYQVEEILRQIPIEMEEKARLEQKQKE